MLSHSETVEYFMCRQPDCGKKFITQRNLDLHLKNHTMPKVNKGMKVETYTFR